ncbi:hypothetical protein PFISCL1PPCAC_15859, partial [Pristionchus fissidentatus]
RSEHGERIVFIFVLRVLDCLPMANAMPEFIDIGGEELGEFCVPRSLCAGYSHPIGLEKGGYGLVVQLESKVPSLPDRAVKMFFTPFKDVKKAQRCYRELQLLSGLRHEHIVKMRSAYVTETTAPELYTVYLTMDYAGVNLFCLIRQESEELHVITLRMYKKMLSQLLRALKYLHSANVIHRDLKPDNIAIDNNWKLTLIDFGLARAIDNDNIATRNAGMSFYRALEATAFSDADETLDYNEKVDMWSLGAILCEMIIGTPIFEHSFPLGKAIEICGTVPERILKMIETRTRNPTHVDKLVIKDLRRRSRQSERKDFLDLLSGSTARSWLRGDVTSNGDLIVDFINRTLNFDPDNRMSVKEALAHPFLAEVREESREVDSGRLRMTDDAPSTIEECRDRILQLVREHRE